ncbi:MAG: DALR anticodon-binding domain-containing protein, partial [Gemmatimonadota bacterium]
TPFVFLANIDPRLQLQVLEQVEKPKLVAMDTMNFWIESRSADLLKLLGHVDLITLNDGEARQLTEQSNLVKALGDYPAMLAGAAEALEPHRVATYALETARLVHTWYHKHHVLGEPEPVMRARLVLAKAAQVVLADALGLLGCSAPERM